MNLLKIICSLVVLLTGAASLAQASATWTTIDVPGATSSVVFRINGSGEIVGSYYDTSNAFHGFLLSGGSFTTIDFPGASVTSAVGINDSGQIVGAYYLPNTLYHGFLFDGQTFTTIDFPGASMTVAVDINNAGQIVGVYTNHNGQDHGFELNSGIFTTIEPAGSTFSELNGINNLGNIVGDFSAPREGGRLIGFVYSEGKFKRKVDFPGADGTSALGLNDLRQVVGLFQTTSSPPLDKGFAFVKGTFIPRNFPGAVDTIPFGINYGGDIVGYYIDSSGGEHGFLRQPGQ